MSLPKINAVWHALPEVSLQEPDGSRGRYRYVGARVLPKSWARKFLEWVGLIDVVYDVNYEFELVEDGDGRNPSGDAGGGGAAELWPDEAGGLLPLRPPDGESAGGHRPAERSDN